MSNWCMNAILISGPSEDLRVLYKSLVEYDAEVKSKENVPDKPTYRDWETDRKSTRLNSSHSAKSRMPSSA